MKKIFIILCVIGFACGFCLIFFTGGEKPEFSIRPQEGGILFLLTGVIFFTGYIILNEIGKLRDEIRK
jgi:drug/metabolite transporter (DMT)-like permease